MARNTVQPPELPGLTPERDPWLGAGSHSAPRVTTVERRLVQAMAERLGRPQISFVLWDGEELAAGSGRPVARVLIHDRGALLRLVANPKFGFGDLYCEGRITIEGDLLPCLEAVYRAMVARAIAGGPHVASARARRPRHANTAVRSRANVHHHYDIGSDFYALWLDPEFMQYTCAYYPHAGMTLEQAQRAKLRYVCRKLRLRPGETVIEAGCGWGGLARFMAREFGARVRSYNISHDQIVYARQSAAREGLDDRVEFIEDDFRSIEGDCDVFVSVGMLEHVGPAHYGELGRVIDRCLLPGGRGLIHSIGRFRPAPLNAWIERRIFPGGYPPTLGQMMEIFEPWSFAVQDVENLRLHYAWTLRHWLERFREHEEQVLEMYDRRFVRAWRLYLAGSTAAFTAGSLQLFQVVFNRPLNNDLPRSRSHLYL